MPLAAKLCAICCIARIARSLLRSGLRSSYFESQLALRERWHSVRVILTSFQQKQMQPAERLHLEMVFGFATNSCGIAVLIAAAGRPALTVGDALAARRRSHRDVDRLRLHALIRRDDLVPTRNRPRRRSATR